MKKLIFILIVTPGFAACNGGEEQNLQNCINTYYGQYDTIHIQSVPSVGVDLYNAGYDTSKVLIILPPGKQ